MSLIMFDLVATLINSGPRYVEAYMRVSEEYGQQELPTRAKLTQMLGEKNLKQIVAECSPQITPARLGQFMDDCNHMCDSLLTDDTWTERLYEGTFEALKTLKSQGHELGIYTGTREDAMSAQVYFHGLIEYFNPNYIEGKNNERDGMLDSASLKTMQLRRIKSAYQRENPEGKIVVVGDSVADWTAARNLDLQFIGLARTETEKRKFDESGLGITVDTLAKLPELVTTYPYPASASPATRSIP